MRSSSVFARCAGVAACFYLISCASSPPAAEKGESLVTLEGELTTAGSPAERTIVLSDAGGSVCTIRSLKLEHELLNLAGLRVRVVGRVTGKTPAAPEFLVERYEMLPIDGRTPFIGTLEIAGGAPVLRVQPSGAGYVLRGRLAAALMAFVGDRVWVSGALESGGGAPADGPRDLTVENYGVLGPALPLDSREP